MIFQLFIIFFIFFKYFCIYYFLILKNIFLFFYFSFFIYFSMVDPKFMIDLGKKSIVDPEYFHVRSRKNCMAIRKKIHGRSRKNCMADPEKKYIIDPCRSSLELCIAIPDSAYLPPSLSLYQARQSGLHELTHPHRRRYDTQMVDA